MHLFKKINNYIKKSNCINGVLVIHSDLSVFGKKIIKYKIDLIDKIFNEISLNTLCIPTFSYYKDKIVFNKNDPAIKMGSLPNFAIKHKTGYRINNPIHSYIIIGKDKFSFKKSSINKSFGAMTIFDKFYKSNALWCSFGCEVNKGFTIFHHAEVIATVKYRNWIKLKRKILVNKRIKEIEYNYYARDIGTEINFKKGIDYLIKKKVLFLDRISGQKIYYGNVRKITDALVNKLNKNNNFLVKNTYN
jgi:aminoglycoside N3'-acetyltransferase